MQKGFSTQWLDELKSKADIVSVVSRYVKLEQRGGKFWGCCPFHNEKTPSFCVNPEGVYHCFGCKEGGDTIRFIEKMENLEFSDAVKHLAEIYHVDLPEIDVKSDEIIKKKNQKDRILKVLECAYKHYQENLYLPAAKKAQDYIKLRKFTKRELDDFKIGYSLSWNEMYFFLKKKGFSDQDMLDAGLIAKRENGGYFDVFGNRLIFPIFNCFNECIGFSARVLEKTDFAKYKNTATTPVFEKNKVVFAINLLRKLKQEGGLKEIILCEGQIDVIMMHRAGFRSAVASLGTALTENHARELKKYSDSILICYDGDEAGVKSAIRAIDILRPFNFNIKVVSLPEGKDPDEVIKEEGKEKLNEYLLNALPVMDYLIKVELKKYNLDKPEEKTKFTKAVLEHIKKLDLESEREVYLEKLRDITNIPIDILRKDLNYSKTVHIAENSKEEVLTVRENGNIKAEKFILASLLHNKDYVDRRIDYFKLLDRRKELVKIATSGTKLSSLYDEYDVDNMPMLKDMIYFNFEEFKGTLKQYFDECVWLVAEEILKQKQQEISKEFNACSDIDKRREIMNQMQKIMTKIREKNLEDFYG